jgi:hypothetical protein
VKRGYVKVGGRWIARHEARMPSWR